jgi:basic membrane protein A and related proteins
MRRLTSRIFFAPVLVLFLLLAACGGTSNNNTGSGTTPTAKPSIKVALVTDIGGLNDQGFNHLSYLGYTKAQQQYGFKTAIIQTQSQTDYVKNLTTAAEEVGSGGLVVAVGFLMQTPLYSVAKQFPSTNFAIVDGCAVPNATTGACATLPNVSPLFFKEQEAGCLVGAISGQMEVDGKSKVSDLLGFNTVGVVGGQSIPPVNRYIAGFEFCIKKIDPKVTIELNYSNDFANTALCKSIAQSQISQHHADIIFQVAGGCGIGALDAAYQNHVYGIGVDADQGYIHPDVITSALKRVDVAVYDIINDAEQGKYSNNLPRFDLAHNGVGYAPVNSQVPQDAVAKAQAFQQQILAGTLTPPENVP